MPAPQHPGNQQAPQNEYYTPNAQLQKTQQSSMDEAAGQQARIEGAYAEKEMQKEQQVNELATAIATGAVSEQELQQLPPELVQRAVDMVQSQQIQEPETGQGLNTPGLDFVEQDSYAQQGPDASQLAQAIQNGQVGEAELQQMDPVMVQEAVSMIQQGASAAPQSQPSPDAAGLAQAIQSGQISEEELAQTDPQLVQSAVQMLQEQGQ